MAITVGTNAYITEAEYQAYALERGITPNISTLETDIILSADFIDTYYNFKGQPVSDAQAMKLPTGCVAIADIRKGALKAAELQQAGRLALDTAALSGGLIESESKSLDGVGSKSVTYVAGSQVTYKARVPELDLLLRPFTVGSTGLRKS